MELSHSFPDRLGDFSPQEGGPGQSEQLLADLIAQAGEDDPRAVSRKLLDEFGSLPALLSEDNAARVAEVSGSTLIAARLEWLRRAIATVLGARLEARPVLSSSSALRDYLQATLAGEPREQLRVLYLNARNELLREELASLGSSTELRAYPRQILKRALDLGATGMIFVHNHPSGDPTPSQVDVEWTRRLRDAAHHLELEIHDHIIVAAAGIVSMRATGDL